MAIALVSEVEATPGSGGGTTGAIDTTGANLIVIGVARNGASAGVTPTDSKSNTYTALTKRDGTGGGSDCQLYYCASPTVGSGHTFTYSEATSYPVIMVAAFSGAHATPFDQESGAANSLGESCQPGSLTPPEDNCLFCTIITFSSSRTNVAIGSSFTNLGSNNFTGGVNYGGFGIAYKIQTTGGAENPTWSWTTSGTWTTAMATFKAAAAAANARRNWLGNRKGMHHGIWKADVSA